MSLSFLTMGATEYGKFYDWVEKNYPGPHMDWESFASEYLELHEWLERENYQILKDYKEWLLDNRPGLEAVARVDKPL